ncbi:MAG: dienelactone hydrolase family protein, partial [Planctomycetota bacterium]
MGRSWCVVLFSVFCGSVVVSHAGEVVGYADGDETLKGYLAVPADADGPLPGVLVVPEWWG